MKEEDLVIRNAGAHITKTHFAHYLLCHTVFTKRQLHLLSNVCCQIVFRSLTNFLEDSNCSDFFESLFSRVNDQEGSFWKFQGSVI